ncbi:MAG: DUF2608 domain-containing protein [Puniceicoccales bacterium]|jgi:hypothetical protein|nr:DUF2608 domain-containing protein [Puniceicoccales bacterium]
MKLKLFLLFISSTVIFLTTIVGSEIITAKSEANACNLLEKACAVAIQKGRTPIIIVDIGEVIIGSGSDMDSYMHYSNFSFIEPINLELMECLRNVVHQGGAKAIGLTSSRGNDLAVDPKGKLITVDREVTCNIQKEDTIQATGKFPTTKIRSDAMQFLKMPFRESFGDRQIVLPLVTDTEDVTALPEDIDKDSKALLSLKSPQYGYPENMKFLIHRFQSTWEAKGLTSSNAKTEAIIKDELYLKEKGQKSYRKVMAFPTYVCGVIFSNGVDTRTLLPKGQVLDSFLHSEIFDVEHAVIIGIDDNLAMLQSMEEQCDRQGIPFFGLHLGYMNRSMCRLWPIRPSPNDFVIHIQKQ